MTVALSVEQLEAGYEPGLPIVRGASLEVRAGEVVAIPARNGELVEYGEALLFVRGG